MQGVQWMSVMYLTREGDSKFYLQKNGKTW